MHATAPAPKSVSIHTLLDAVVCLSPSCSRIFLPAASSCCRYPALDSVDERMHNLGEEAERDDDQADGQHDERDADRLPVTTPELRPIGNIVHRRHRV